MRVSVVIPTLNEQSCLSVTLEQLCIARPAEIIVADGGSQDGTISLAKRYARVVDCPAGRAVQQNCAARAATGDVLLFLHADCCPGPGWLGAIERAVSRRNFTAGCFRMHIDSPRWGFRIIEYGVELRVRWLGLPYGDQGLFLRRDTFCQLGGFPRVQLMEDVMFVRRLRCLGRVEMLKHPVTISPRRWERVGLVQQTLHNWILAAALWSGVDPERLARFYPAVR